MTLESYKNRILVVDDNEATLYLFKKMLEGQYTLFSASGGREALRILNEQVPPDIILLDIMMPEMSGYTLFEEIKKDPRIASIPILFVTALGSQSDEEKGLATGAVDYIVKPIVHQVLLARIKNILELSQYQRDAREKLPEILGELFPEESNELSITTSQESINDELSRIVIVNPGFRADTHDLFQHELSGEYEITQFINDTDAFEFCVHNRQTDLILLDLDFKEERFEIIKKFKTSPQTATIPIILLTSLKSKEDETAAFQVGCADYITKPIYPPILKARIHIHVELKKHRQYFEQQLQAFMNE